MVRMFILVRRGLGYTLYFSGLLIWHTIICLTNESFLIQFRLDLQIGNVKHFCISTEPKQIRDGSSPHWVITFAQSSNHFRHNWNTIASPTDHDLLETSLLKFKLFSRAAIDNIIDERFHSLLAKLLIKFMLFHKWRGSGWVRAQQ